MYRVCICFVKHIPKYFIITRVLVSVGRGVLGTLGEDDAKMEAEVRVTWPQPKECWQLPEALRAKG